MAALLMGTSGAQAARAETVVERAARTGVITLGGRTDLVPYSFLNDQGELVGYGVDVARRIEAEVSRYLGKPVRVEFEAVSDPDTLFKQVSRGEIALSCGAQFTWEREMFVDFSIPFSLSGIRILTRANGFSGTPDSLAGKRIAVVPGSLGEKAVRDLRPQAIRVAVPGLKEGVASLTAGRVDGFAGDSILLAGAVAAAASPGLALVPEDPLVRYAVGCMMPENNSTFRNLVNLAIAQMIQGYVIDEPAATATVNRWLGPGGVLELPPELIKAYFQTVLLNHEQINVPTTR
ncbi:extracellular substrate binding-like orphan protein GrrP [Cyanobium sp. ATX 6A2]|uniref:extracellular substrate binding-like orphan protein GrrP n=1 Tax=Cyanobium sp. ATX 6A2 TaxID=2823700 RepID=UPI0020CD31CA|nr:extracellular substrate binding-like orphan protein GrrP [Cyanobium sp. ATX 6A2]MCP9889410.1 extracellular substrate binding-like orphan protein GrrP [Cyanobium sp. ATX 6A2]